MKKLPPNQLGKKWKITKPRTEQWRKKQSDAHKHLVGEKNARWLGGRRDYCINFVRQRDKNTCQKCGYHNDEFGSLAVDVDHLLPKNRYPELEFDTNNMEVLCPNCHRLKHIRSRKLGGRIYE
jgi:5-methylcytosine-specific restriction endonuclease McrA